jgi:hypothetical protein
MIDFNINQYLSEEDKKRIATQVWREQLEAKFKSDGERIISNAAYDIVSKMCDDIVPDFHELLVEKVKGVVKGLSAHTVFGPPNAWDRKATIGWTMMNEIVATKRERIDNKVDKIIDELQPNVVNWEIDLDYEIRQMLAKRLGWE